MSMQEVVSALTEGIKSAHRRPDVPLNLDADEIRALVHHLAYDVYEAAFEDECDDNGRPLRVAA